MVVRDGRHQRIRRRVDGRGHQPVRERARRWRRSFPTAARCRASSAVSCPGCIEDVPWDRVTSGEYLQRLPRQPDRRHPVHTVVPILAAHIRTHHLRKAGAVAAHARARARLADDAADPVERSSIAGSSSIRRPDDLFQVANEVSGRDLTPFFDQVYRGSAVFDYGVDSVTSAEDRRRDVRRTTSSSAATATESSRSPFS